MYLAIDIGGTKTLVAAVEDNGVIARSQKFPTPLEYKKFLKQLEENLKALGEHSWKGAGVGVPAVVNYADGSVPRLANLPWKEVTLQADLHELLGCRVRVENDANLAGLSEAMLVKDQFQKVLYVTVSTGIGGGYIVNQRISADLADLEPGHMLLQHEGKLQEWEVFASGRAIYQKYGQYAHDIYDTTAWREITENIGCGLIILEAVIQPDVIIIGGSIGTYFERYADYLTAYLQEHNTTVVPARPVRSAQRPEQAVVYGCYDLASQK